ncbi:sensor histidine kinase [Halalkalibaculum sp. DA3122]|uniref:sensor histidine kinase n=1 Tax=Halalkalibaculum sp. DA3122 TaxID=3373607 RepID=UPI003754CA2F
MKALSLPHRHGLKITSIYLIISAGWIFFSDLIIVEIFEDQAIMAQVQTYKGLFFVVVTAALLYYLIGKNTASILKSRARLEMLIKQKQTLLSELHHRVKNNLAIVTGLIELQANTMDEADTEALQETQFRIYTLANIEELLYKEKDFTKIPFHECMRYLVSNLEQSVNSPSSIQANIDEVNLNINQAIPLGLLINEIFTQLRVNGYKGKIGSVRIDLNYYLPNKVKFNLQLVDLPEKAITKLVETGHIELKLVDLYTKQLKATSGWETTSNGYNFHLEFNKSDRSGSAATMAQSM